MYEEYWEQGFELSTPCKTCFPGVHSYNEAAYQIYVECQDQLILGMSGAVAINVLAIYRIMDELKIKEKHRKEIRRKVKVISSSELAEYQKKAKKVKVK